jgi:hypothetical protein
VQVLAALPLFVHVGSAVDVSSRESLLRSDELD